MKTILSRVSFFLFFFLFLSFLSYAPVPAASDLPIVGLYLGMEHSGEDTISPEDTLSPETSEEFTYLFSINDRRISLKLHNGTPAADGTYDYPIQNQLKEGYRYELQIEDGMVTAVTQLPSPTAAAYEPPVSGTPGKRTLKNFLATAFMPVGTTLYIYGGGWNWQDTGASVQAKTLGLSSDWIQFFQSRDSDFTYRGKNKEQSLSGTQKDFYPYNGFNEYYYAGLDCSGYVGWVLYNTLHTENGNPGYVMPASEMARAFGEKGWGTWSKEVSSPIVSEYSAFSPGDIFSIDGHVWICLGTCADDSILLLHSTPAPSRTGQPGGGPELSALGDDTSCDAYRLADTYMSRYYPEWYRRYPVVLKDRSLYTLFDSESTGRFSWDLSAETGILQDPDSYADRSPEDILKDLFAE